MIPKIIHYCWFGHNPKSALAEKCIKSWRKYCPDYQIIEWNENSFDLDSAPLYARQAYEAKKWAFVTDYVRLYVLYTIGGIYMDTDVEVIQSLDSFLKHRGFSGFEDEAFVPTGIMAAEKEHCFIGKLLKEYELKTFYNDDGSLNLETNVISITRQAKKLGLILNNSLQTIDQFTFYPRDYFCPKNLVDRKIYKTPNTVTIHHFAGSWVSEKEKRESKKRIAYLRRDKYLRPIKNRIKNLIGESLYSRVKYLIKH